jgi:plasmid stabilization system protein ParE
MLNYTIHFSRQSKIDVYEIYNYIKYELFEPDIAKRKIKELYFYISKLEYSALSFKIIKIDKIKSVELRKYIVKNYLVFYTVDKDKKIVDIKRIIYGKTNWLDIF